MTQQSIIQAIIAIWFVFFFATMDASKGSFLHKVLYKMLPAMFAFLLGLIVFKVI